MFQKFQTAQTSRKQRLAPDLLRAVPPAYAFPALSTFANAQLIGNDALATAAFTTIAIPSAAAAAAVTVRDHVRPRRRGLVRAAISGAAIGLFPALAVTGALVTNDIAASAMWWEAPPSAAIGGAVASVLASRRAARAHRQQADTPVDPREPGNEVLGDRTMQTVGVR
ncbi:MAG: hypothetical protein AAGD33_17215 [Actinomycetota bacterium]